MGLDQTQASFLFDCIRPRLTVKLAIFLAVSPGSSLKLTVLNPHGRVWTMVAGGGASVVYADSIADNGQGGELANYGTL